MKKNYKETITIQSVRGITASEQRGVKKHNINTKTKPHIKSDKNWFTQRNVKLFVKDRDTFPLTLEKGNTEINLRRQQEDQKKEKKKKKQSSRTSSQQYCKINNHITDWNNKKVIGT